MKLIGKTYSGYIAEITHAEVARLSDDKLTKYTDSSYSRETDHTGKSFEITANIEALHAFRKAGKSAKEAAAFLRAFAGHLETFVPQVLQEPPVEEQKP